MAKKENKEKKEKNGKGGITGAAIAALILLLGGGAWGTGLLPGSSGIGNGNNTNPTQPVAENTDDKDVTNKDDKTEKTVIILLEQSQITVDGVVCEAEDNVKEMTEKISSMYNQNSKIAFEFQEKFSIKSKHDEVVAALKNTAALLKITIKGVE